MEIGKVLGEVSPTTVDVVDVVGVDERDTHAIPAGKDPSLCLFDSK
jgi:hypothetical protein